jgi:hypothetical protein
MKKKKIRNQTSTRGGSLENAADQSPDINVAESGELDSISAVKPFRR